MVGRPKKRSGFRGALNNGAKKFIYDETENKDFTFESSNTILNSSDVIIGLLEIRCTYFKH